MSGRTKVVIETVLGAEDARALGTFELELLVFLNVVLLEANGGVEKLYCIRKSM